MRLFRYWRGLPLFEHELELSYHVSNGRIETQGQINLSHVSKNNGLKWTTFILVHQTIFYFILYSVSSKVPTRKHELAHWKLDATCPEIHLPLALALANIPIFFSSYFIDQYLFLLKSTFQSFSVFVRIAQQGKIKNIFFFLHQ